MNYGKPNVASGLLDTRNNRSRVNIGNYTDYKEGLEKKKEIYTKYLGTTINKVWNELTGRYERVEMPEIEYKIIEDGKERSINWKDREDLELYNQVKSEERTLTK